MTATDHNPDMGLLAPDQAAKVRLAENTPAERRDASRYVLRKARSRADLRDLLNVTGLNQPPREEAK